MGLEDLEFKVVKVGIHRAFRESRFLPTPAEIRELAGVVKPLERTVLAFQAVRKAVQKHTSYESVVFDDPVVTATVRCLGGWIAVCEIKSGVEFDDKLAGRFERTYIRLCASGVSPDLCKPLFGSLDRENFGKGFHQAIKPAAVIACGLPEHRKGIVRDMNHKIGNVQKRIVK